MKIKYGPKIKYYFNYDISCKRYFGEFIENFSCFKDDKKDGESKYWYDNGKLMME